MIDDSHSSFLGGADRLEETGLISHLLDQFDQGTFIRRADGTVILNSRLRRLLGVSQAENIIWEELKSLLLKACGEGGTSEDQEGLRDLLDNPQGGQLIVPLSTFPQTIRRCRILVTPLCFKESDVWWGVIVPEVEEPGGFLSDQWNALSLMNAILDGISDAIFVVEEKTLTIQRCNKAASQIFRIPPHQLVGKPIRSFFANPQKLDDLAPHLEVRLRALGSLHMDTELVRMDGEQFSALCSITGVYDARGYQMAFLWVVSDVSHHVFLNRSHYELETRYRLLFNRIADPTLIIDAQTGQILDCNVAAEQHLGYTRAELIKLTANDVTPSERIEGMKRDFDRIKSGEGSTFEGVNLTKSGKKIPV
ncbi:MAG: PAS domain-containing protein, partial [bacterium]